MQLDPGWEDIDLSIVNELEIDAFSNERSFSDAREYGIMLDEMIASYKGSGDYLRALEMLKEIMKIRASIDMPNMRFEPCCIFDGHRTSAAEDFIGKAVDEIVSYSNRTSHLVVRARLKHLAWYIERKRKDVGEGALDAYIDLLNDLDVREYFNSSSGKKLSYIKYEIICMAYCVLRGLGYPENKEKLLNSITKKIFCKCCEEGEVRVAHDFVKLSLSCKLIDREFSVNCLKELINSDKSDISGSIAADLWKLCACVYNSINKTSEAHRCQVKAAEVYIEMSKHFESEDNHMLAAHWMEYAIIAYHGVPSASGERVKLRRKLANIQENTLEQLGTIEMLDNCKFLAQDTQKRLEDLDVFDSLFAFTAIASIPSSEELSRISEKMRREHPLLSLFPSQRLDRDGKTIDRSSDSNRESNEGESSFNFIDDLESSNRRIYAVHGSINVARAMISSRYNVSRDLIFDLFGVSPTVPPHLRETLSIGFEKYFTGDMVSAAYILTPLLEGMIRHILKLHGCCTTRFDESDGTQENLSLSSLVVGMHDEICRALTSDYVREIVEVFVARHGPRMRNRIAHAELYDNEAYGHDINYGCWLIWLLAIVPLFPYRDKIAQQLREHHPCG